MRRPWLAITCLSLGCTTTHWQATFVQPSRAEELNPEAFLQCHMPAGEVYILDRWSVDGDDVVRGSGILYDRNRLAGVRGTFEVPLGSIALLETTRPERVRRNDRIAAIAVPIAGGGLLMLGFVAALASGHK